MVAVGDDCTTLIHPEGVGAFQLSSHHSPLPLTDDDLWECAGDVPLSPVSFGGLTGFHRRFSEDGTFWARWWLRAGRRILHITYNCAVADRGGEAAAIEAMVSSLRVESAASDEWE